MQIKALKRNLLFILTLFAIPYLAFADNGKTHEYPLNNGLKLIVKEDHRAPVVVSQVWYKVGGSYEYGGITGISHMLEHMMFKGTKQHPPGEFSRIIANNGGQQNAMTGMDFTVYFQELAADKLALSFELESDRMQNLQFSEKEFKPEHQVVISERRLRIDDVPSETAYERFTAAANIATAYHHPLIGWLTDMEHYTLQDVQQWYQKWYAPNNALLVVVGDVQPEQVLALAKKYFGPIPNKPLPSIKPQSEVPPLGERRVTVKIPAQLPVLFMGYNVPNLVTATEKQDAYALEVIAGILAGGDSARLAKEIIRQQQKASTATVDYDLYARLDSLFTLQGIPTPRHNVTELESAFRDQIKRLQTSLVSPDELSRIKSQVVANKIYRQDSIDGQAFEIGQLEALGLSWKIADEYVKNIQAITPEQIQQTAKRYLIPARLTVAILEPLPMTSLTTKGGRNVH